MTLTVEPYPRRRAKTGAYTITKRLKRPQVKKKKEKTISALMKDLDAVFSRFVRLSYANADGMVECYTCPHVVHYKKIHAGHYVSRFYKATRWDEDNVRPQCMMDNLWKRGDPVVFRENLVKELGEARVKELEQSRHISMKLQRDFLCEKIAYYQAKVATLLEVK